uniref:DNA-directed RNA polymerase n=1 Tax=viral metagenome TaxID=1070528 RepID=A0A6C0KT87_9ZZZZ
MNSDIPKSEMEMLSNSDSIPSKEETSKAETSKSEIPWILIESYFKHKHLKQLVKHQLESYNYFVNNQIQQTIEMFNPLLIVSDHDYIKEHNLHRLEIEITFENFSIYRPQIYENNGSTKIMFPQEARLRNISYSSAMTIDLNIKYTVRNGENYKNVLNYQKKIKNVHIGKLPIMLKSDLCVLNQYKHLDHNETGECYMDPGGYFIINGSEKTCISQERAAENQIYCFNIEKNNNKWSWKAEMKCIPDWKCISPKQITMYIASRNNGYGNAIYLQIPRIKIPIPLFIIFRAFNIISDKEICELIMLNIANENMKKMLFALKASIIDANKCMTKESAIKFIVNNVIYTPMNMDKETGSKKKYDFAMEVLSNDIFPHCKTETQKIYMLGYMTNMLLQTSFGWLQESDRDSYMNKRIDLTGPLLNNLLRNYFNKLVKDMKKQIIREINSGSWKSNDDYENIITKTNIYKIIKSTTIEQGIKRALATGDFGIKQINSNKVGVAQVLNRLTYLSSLSHLRRVNTPIDKSGKLVPPRRLHNSTWGFLCPAETPEGQSVGVVKNLAYLSHITINSNSSGLYDYILPIIQSLDTYDGSYKDLDDYAKVFINGSWVGITNDPEKVYINLKDKKYKGIINIYTSIIFNSKLKEIRVCNDAGRITRPLLKIKHNEVLYTNSIIQKIKDDELTWDDLVVGIKLEDSIIEYVDSYEQNNAMIAMKTADLANNNCNSNNSNSNNSNSNNSNSNSNNIYHYSHCEIHPSTIFGILASCIPFPDSNQSPRNTYQSAMGKQAIGMYVTNYDNRMDKTAYVLTYPMRPLVETRIMNIIKLNNIPSGQQVIVAIASHSGYNQEDSLLFNKGSIDRGLFLATIYHTEKDEDKKLFGTEEVRCKPDKTKTKNIKFGNYDKLTSQGIMKENTLIEDRDIIIGKVIPIKENKNDFTKSVKFSDGSISHRTQEESYVDKNYIETNGDGYNFCKVRIRNFRKPVIGDKFSSRHGQKGTIGNIIPEEDMPFTASGLKPDIIINPHAIPSRMTIAQLKETLLGKVLLEMGLFGDGTSFGEFDISNIIDKLNDLGYESKGNELMYNALTGEQLTMNIFIGPAFYQRLKHMVNDKQHSRSIGPMVNLTRQPAEGRSRDGGLRFGEMERDCMISHGASRFTKGRIYDASDAFSVFVCNKCGLIASFNNKEHIHYCNTCGNRNDFKYVEIPYACKLMFQELITMNIAPRIMCE